MVNLLSLVMLPAMEHGDMAGLPHGFPGGYDETQGSVIHYFCCLIFCC